MTCQVPELCEERKTELINISRRKRETRASTGAVQVEIIIYLDGVQQSFSISYYSDPSFSPFDEDNKVKLFESKNKKLTIMVNYDCFYFCLTPVSYTATCMNVNLETFWGKKETLS